MTGGSGVAEQESLWVVGVGGVDERTLRWAAEAAREKYGADARVRSETLDLAAYDAETEPYHGLDLAEWCRERVGESAVLVVTDAEIEKPRGDPAYGLAYRNGSLGIVSTARLGDPNAPAFEQRLRTQVSQHVGYLVGMGACRAEGCLFRVAESLADVDRLGPDPCADCRAELATRESPLLPGGGPGGDEAAETDGFDGPSAVPETLWVVGVGDVDGDTLETAAAAVRELYPLDVRIHPDPIGPEGLADGGQVSEPVEAIDLADYARLRADRADTLAVTSLDIDHTDEQWVFGIAELGGSVAAVSTARLGERDTDRFRRRLRAQARRQVSRLLGKGYCQTHRCLFAPADSEYALDMLETDPCDSCRAELDELREGTPADRGRRSPSKADAEADGSERTDGSANEVTHTIVSTVRFWTAVGGYVVSLFLTAFVTLSILDVLPVVGTPTSDAGNWAFVIAMLVVAYLVYRSARRWVGRGGRWVLGYLRGKVAGRS